MNYKVMDNRIRVYDSFAVKKDDIERELAIMRELYPEHCIWKRSFKSLKLEWAAHNLLYSLGYKPERTKDVDLDYPQEWYYKVGYAILGTIALSFID